MRRPNKRRPAAARGTSSETGSTPRTDLQVQEKNDSGVVRLAPVESAPKPGDAPIPSFPVAGIGASAGGLEAFTQLLRALPADTGIAFVLVQHLDPKHESMLPAILSRATRMPVREVKAGMRVEPNHVYVIPPNTSMTISEGVLHLAARAEPRGWHLPIDCFFRSLAEDQRSNAIGVILSGTASDGVLGMSAIKAEGGITFAQDEKSAKYADMPRNAMATGGVDVVLPPDQIARELARIGRHPAANHYRVAPAHELVPEGDGLGEIFTILRRSTGVDFTHYKQTTVKRRIARRLVLHKLDSLDDFVQVLRENPREAAALCEDLLINVTGFFRDPETFEALKKALPKMMKIRSPAEAPIRVWVPGCSTGEEAYSIAITLLEFLVEKHLSNRVQIFGSDLSEKAIDRARSGIYPSSIEADVSTERLQRFFAKAKGGYHIGKTVRDMCVFAKQDLIRDPPFSNLDLISCCNVLIYLGRVLQQKVMTLFHYGLKPTGLLILGKAEGMTAFSELFAPLRKGERIYSRQPSAHRLSLGFPAGEHVPAAAVGSQMRREERLPESDVHKESDRVVAKYGPGGFTINDKLEVLRFHGRTGRYLDPDSGDSSFYLLKLLRPPLALEVRSAIHKATKKHSPVRKEGIRFKQGGKSQEVNLRVIPIKSSPAGERHLVVLFEDVKLPARPETAATKGDAPRPRNRRQGADPRKVLQLKRELAAAKQYLHDVVEEQEATNEELKSAGEELQSRNEEIQSTNEELETAKEELQSTNEELHTLNETLQQRNGELTDINDELKRRMAQLHAISATTDGVSRATNLDEIYRLALDGLQHTLKADRAALLLFDADGTMRLKVWSGLSDEYRKAVEEHSALLSDAKDLRPICVADVKVERSLEALQPTILAEGIQALASIPVVEQGRVLGEFRAYCNTPRLFDEQDVKVGQTIASYAAFAIARQFREGERSRLLVSEQAARAEAESANRAKDEFLAVVSHELRTPLTAVLGYARLLGSGKKLDEANRTQALDAIQRNAKLQAQLVEDLLDGSRIMSAKLHLNMQPLRLEPLARAAVAAVHPMAQAKTIDIQLVVEAGINVIRGDPVRLQQVLGNLLSNAIKFTPPGGRIEMRLDPADLGVRVSVSDTGIGIAPEFLPHVFERFRQFESSSKRSHQGLGLGLAIVHRLVELHGGTVHAESPGLGKGAKFTVELPVPAVIEDHEPKALDASEMDHLEMTPRLDGVHLLVVDDRADARSMLALTLWHCGAEVRLAESVPEALAEIERAKPDVLISDIAMPGEDGYDLIRKVRALESERGGKIPALALTAYAGRDDAARALEAGYQMHLVKPVEPAKLAAAVESLLEPAGALAVAHTSDG